MVNQINPSELQLKKANTPFWIYIFLFLMVLFPLKFMINAMTLLLILYFLDGDVPRRPSYGVYISHLIRCARVCSHVEE